MQLAGMLIAMSNAALPLEPENLDLVKGSRLSRSDREIIQEWLHSGALEETLLQLDIEDVEIQHAELQHRWGNRSKTQNPRTE